MSISAPETGSEALYFAPGDPLAELAHLVGFAPSKPKAVAFDLEDELLREFERYDVRPAEALEPRVEMPKALPAGYTQADMDNLEAFEVEVEDPNFMDHVVRAPEWDGEIDWPDSALMWPLQPNDPDMRPEYVLPELRKLSSAVLERLTRFVRQVQDERRLERQQRADLASLLENAMLRVEDWQKLPETERGDGLDLPLAISGLTVAEVREHPEFPDIVELIETRFGVWVDVVEPATMQVRAVPPMLKAGYEPLPEATKARIQRIFGHAEQPLV